MLLLPWWQKSNQRNVPNHLRIGLHNPLNELALRKRRQFIFLLAGLRLQNAGIASAVSALPRGGRLLMTEIPPVVESNYNRGYVVIVYRNRALSAHRSVIYSPSAIR